MEEDQPMIFEQSYFYDLDYENKLCADCRAPLPNYISINNSVIICSTCAMRHMSLGYNVSYVIPISSELDQYLLTYISRGGNSRFLRFCAEYGLDSFPIETKYTTNIMLYYRLLIKSEVLAEEPPEPFDKEYNLYPCQLQADFFPEFNNYQLYKGEVTELTKNEAMKEKFKQVIETIGNGVASTAKYVAEKAEQNDFKGKVTYGYQTIKKTGGYVVSKTVPVLKYLTKKTIGGLGYLLNTIDENLGDSQTITQEDDKKENKKEDEKEANKNENEKEHKSVDNNLNQIDKPQINNKQIENINEQYEFSPVGDFPTFEEVIKSNTISLTLNQGDAPKVVNVPKVDNNEIINPIQGNDNNQKITQGE